MLNANILSDEIILKEGIKRELQEKQCNITENLNEANYFFVILGFTNKRFYTEEKIFNELQQANSLGIKTLVVLPYVNYGNGEYINYIAEAAKQRKIQVIYIGQLFGKEIPDSFYPIVNKGHVYSPSYDINLYFIDKETAIKEIIKAIFSYGFNKEEVVLTASINAFNLVKRLNRKFEVDTTISQVATQPVFDFVELPMPTKDIEETMLYLETQKLNPVITVKKKKKIQLKKIELPKVKVSIKIKPKKKINFKFKRVFIALVVVFWIISLPFVLLFVSSFLTKAGYERLREFDLVKANIYLNISKVMARGANTGFLFFDEGKEMAQTTYDIDVVGSDGSSLINRIIKGDRDLYLSTDRIYRETALLSTNKTTSQILPQVDFGQLSLYFENFRKITKNLPDNFLIVQTNKDQLMPSGGKIVKVNNFEVSGLDKELKGYIGPPLALSQYLGQTNWSLAYANWDTDFRNSGARELWFYEKETGEKMEGVVNIDQVLAMAINNAKGSKQKGELIWQGLKNKDIQIFISNEEANQALSNINWSGKVEAQNIFTGIAEANLGKSGSEQIIRSAKLNIEVTAQNINYDLKIDYTNPGDNDYKGYVMVLGQDQLAKVISVKSLSHLAYESKWSTKNDGDLRFLVRKAAGIDMLPIEITFKLPANLTPTSPTRYNTNLNQDYYGEIKYQSTRP